MAALIYIFQWVIGVTVVTFLVSFPIAVRGFRRQAEESGVIDTRWGFALRVVGVSQMLFFLFAAAFIVLTAGFGLFAISIFAFANIWSALLVYIFAHIAYTRVQRRTFGKAGAQSGMTRKVPNRWASLAVCGVAISIFISVFLSEDVRRELFDTAYAEMESVSLIKLELAVTSDGYRKDELLGRLAHVMQDVRICEGLTVSTPLKKNECYYNADPEARRADDNSCSLFNKYGDQSFAESMQSRCISNHLIVDKALTDEPVVCVAIASRFAGNAQVNWLTDFCKRVETFQEARLTDDPGMCSSFLQTDVNTGSDAFDDDSRYYTCIGQFEGSSHWQSACNSIQALDSQSLMDKFESLARCEGSTSNYGSTQDVLRAFFSH